MIKISLYTITSPFRIKSELPVEADRTPLSRSSHLVRFCVASDCSRLTSVSWTSEISFPSVSVSIMPNNRPSSPVSVTMESSLVPSPARVNAWSLTSPASRVTNCRRHPTAARRRRRWELAKVACNTIQKCHNKCDMTQGTLIHVKVSKIFKCTDWLKIRF